MPTNHRPTCHCLACTLLRLAERRKVKAWWDSLPGTGAWDRNEWVRAVTFRRVQP